MRDDSGANAGESGLIWVESVVHRAILHCCSNLRVALDFDSVLGESLKFHQAMKVPYQFDGNTEFLCMQCRGIRPRLAAWGTSHGFSRVAVGTWCIFSSCNEDGFSKLMFVERSQDSCLIMRHTSKSPRGLAGQYGCLSTSCRRPRFPFQLPKTYWDSY